MSERDTKIFHETDPSHVKKRLDGFYGRVARRQDKRIAKYVLGETVLDIGSGYGYLLAYLTDIGYKAEGLEPSDFEVDHSRKWFNVSVTKGSIYATPYNDKSFDTVILRDAIFHIDVEKALPEIKRITSKRCIVFMGNTGPVLKFAKMLLRHEEHDMKTAEEYIEIFRSFGFQCNIKEHSDYLAFPLSGGYISTALVPRNRFVWNVILKFEGALEFVFKLLRIQKCFAFRSLLVFDLQA